MNEHNSLREANVARQAEWDEGNQISLSFRGNELAGEVGEACNVIKKLDRERMGIKGSRDTVQHLAEELADVVICSDLIAAAAGVDLDGAIRDKFNATSEKHGFKTRLTGDAQAATDPLAGLDERLDRLLLTANDNSRFVLSTESAKNIVGIVREWLRVKGYPVSSTHAAPRSEDQS